MELCSCRTMSLGIPLRWRAHKPIKNWEKKKVSIGLGSIIVFVSRCLIVPRKDSGAFWSTQWRFLAHRVYHRAELARIRSTTIKLLYLQGTWNTIGNIELFTVLGRHLPRNGCCRNWNTLGCDGIHFARSNEEQGGANKPSPARPRHDRFNLSIKKARGNAFVPTCRVVLIPLQAALIRGKSHWVCIEIREQKRHILSVRHESKLRATYRQ